MVLEMVSDGREHPSKVSVKVSSRSDIRNHVKTAPVLQVSYWSLRGHGHSWWTWRWCQTGLYEYSLGSFISSVYITFLVYETLPGGHSKLTKNFSSIPALDMLDSYVLGRSQEFSSNFILNLNKLSIHVTLELLCKIVDKIGLSSLIWQRHFRSLTKLGHVINLRTVSSCRQTILFIFTSAKVF